jgi:hypothetical protein
MTNTSLSASCLAALVLSCVPLAARAAPIAWGVRADTGDHLFSIDLATGTATDYGQIPIGAEGLAFSGGRLFAIDGDAPYFWDVTPPGWVPVTWPTVGFGTLIGSTGPRLGLDADLASDSAGRLYNLQGAPSYTEPHSYLYEIDPATGASTLRWSADIYADAFAIDAAGRGFAIDTKVTDALYRVDLTTGVFTLIGSLGLGDILYHSGAAFDATGALWLITTAVPATPSEIYRIDTTTGAASFVAIVTVDFLGHPFGKNGFQSLAIDVGAGRGQAATVPEPGAFVLLATGLGLLRLRHPRTSG